MQTSTTYDSFMYLSLPMPSVEGPSKTSLQSCLDAFVREEVLFGNGDMVWCCAILWHCSHVVTRHCPHCKTLRNATKQLSLSRLPPILLIHLKRFSHKGVFTDKIETVVDFPLKSLDLTNYMPPALPPGIRNSVNSMNGIGSDDPRVQTPPYRYDLYGVTNHFGNPSNGHCEFIRCCYVAFLSITRMFRCRFYRFSWRMGLLWWQSDHADWRQGCSSNKLFEFPVRLNSDHFLRDALHTCCTTRESNHRSSHSLYLACRRVIPYS